MLVKSRCVRNASTVSTVPRRSTVDINKSVVAISFDFESTRSWPILPVGMIERGHQAPGAVARGGVPTGATHALALHHHPGPLTRRRHRLPQATAARECASDSPSPRRRVGPERRAPLAADLR